MDAQRRRLLLVGIAVGVVPGVAAVVVALSGRGDSNPRGVSPTEALANHAAEYVPAWIQKEHLPPAASRGAELFATSGCTACHTYAGSGSSNLNAPDLTAIGSHHLGIAFQVKHLKCPSCVNPGSPMPPFGSLGSTRLHQLAVFLEESKGIR